MLACRLHRQRGEGERDGDREVVALGAGGRRAAVGRVRLVDPHGGLDQPAQLRVVGTLARTEGSARSAPAGGGRALTGASQSGPARAGRRHRRAAGGVPGASGSAAAADGRRRAGHDFGSGAGGASRADRRERPQQIARGAAVRRAPSPAARAARRPAARRGRPGSGKSSASCPSTDSRSRSTAGRAAPRAVSGRLAGASPQRRAGRPPLPGSPSGTRGRPRRGTPTRMKSALLRVRHSARAGDLDQAADAVAAPPASARASPSRRLITLPKVLIARPRCSSGSGTPSRTR